MSIQYVHEYDSIITTIRIQNHSENECNQFRQMKISNCPWAACKNCLLMNCYKKLQVSVRPFSVQISCNLWSRVNLRAIKLEAIKLEAVKLEAIKLETIKLETLAQSNWNFSTWIFYQVILKKGQTLITWSNPMFRLNSQKIEPVNKPEYWRMSLNTRFYECLKRKWVSICK